MPADAVASSSSPRTSVPSAAAHRAINQCARDVGGGTSYDACTQMANELKWVKQRSVGW